MKTAHDIIAIIADDLRIDSAALSQDDKARIRDGLEDGEALLALGFTDDDQEAVEIAHHPMRRARGKGYEAGLTLEPRDPPSGEATRAARYKASGRQIACVIRDPAALAALDRLADKHGGVTAAVTAALLASSK